MRTLILGFIVTLSFASSAFATNPNEYRANFWQLHFSQSDISENSELILVQAHIGETTYREDNQGNPNWDQNFALVTLPKLGDHFYASASTEHTTGPYETGGYRNPVVQFHYFLKGEESQINSSQPFSGGHWTAVVAYGDKAQPNDANLTQFIQSITRTNDPNRYDSLKAQLQSAMSAATDASDTSVNQLQCDFAD